MSYLKVLGLLVESIINYLLGSYLFMLIFNLEVANYLHLPDMNYSTALGFVFLTSYFWTPLRNLKYF